MAFPQASDRGIAGHHADRVFAQSDKCGSSANPRGRMSGVAPSVTATDNEYVEVRLVSRETLLFTQAEARKDFIKDSFHIDSSQ